MKVLRFVFSKRFPQHVWGVTSYVTMVAVFTTAAVVEVVRHRIKRIS